MTSAYDQQIQAELRQMNRKARRTDPDSRTLTAFTFIGLFMVLGAIWIGSYVVDLHEGTWIETASTLTALLVGLIGTMLCFCAPMILLTRRLDA